MSWNYRLVKYKAVEIAGVLEEPGYGIHEVYYNQAGEAWAMTEQPVAFAGDTRDEVLSGMARATLDALENPVFEEPETWPEQD